MKKETDVKEIEVKSSNETPKLKLDVNDANAFMNIISLVLVGDDRMKPLQKHFIEMIKKNNEDGTKQPSK